MTELDALQLLVLDLISPRPDIDPARIAALSMADWDRLMGMVRQHRLGPLLHWQLAQHRPDLDLPPAVKEELDARFKRSTLRALVMRRELVLIHRLLTAAGIPYLALKGAFLAFHAYPQPGLRPLRDLDILVSEAEALRAYEVLIAGGLVRPPPFQGDPTAVMSIHKHLPPLRTASGKATVEVHARLFNPIEGAAELTDPSTDMAFWQRAIKVEANGVALCFPAPTDLLLHLIIHAVLEHQFTNGPLILSDIAFLLERQAIDWAGFWQTANQGHLQRACWLTLRLVELYWGGRNLGWPPVPMNLAGSDQALEQAATLMLRDFNAKSDVGLAHMLARETSTLAKLGILLGRIFPPKARIAAAYPVQADSSAVYLYYLPHLWRLASQRVPDFLQSRRQERVQTEVELLTDLKSWLAG